MPYFAKVMLMDQRFSVMQGNQLIGCPKDLLERWNKEGHIELRGAIERPLIDLPFSDVLTDMNQAQLVKVIVINKLPVRPMSNWPDEKIRQDIRNCCGNVAELELPDANPTPSGQPA